MKVVINKCFGGFGLSPEATRRLAELQGRPGCYFFTNFSPDGKCDLHKHYPISQEDAENGRYSTFWHAYDIPNPDGLTHEEYEKHSLYYNGIPRNDPLLIQVVEEMGAGHRTGASGKFAELAIVEIPDGVEYTIEEYDGSEHIAEAHRTWS